MFYFNFKQKSNNKLFFEKTKALSLQKTYQYRNN